LSRLRVGFSQNFWALTPLNFVATARFSDTSKQTYYLGLCKNPEDGHFVSSLSGTERWSLCVPWVKMWTPSNIFLAIHQSGRKKY